MATFNKIFQFVEDLGKAVHNFTSTGTCSLTVFLTTSGAAVTSGMSVLADVTPIAYTNLTARLISGVSFEQTNGTAALAANDLVLTASGGSVSTFRYIGIYNDTPTSPADPLIGWYDYGDNVTLNSGETLTIDFNTNIITLA